MNEKEKRLTALKNTLGGELCPICALLRRGEFDLLCKWVGKSGLKDGATKERTRLLNSNGFCNYHSWELSKINSMYENAVISADLMKKIKGICALIKESKSIIGRLKDYYNSVACPVCVDLKELESAYLGELINLLDNNENRVKYAQGAGLCMPHLILLAEQARSDSLAKFLLKTEVSQLDKISIDAISLVNKRDPPLRWEQTEAEKDSWYVAFEKLTGRRGFV